MRNLGESQGPWGLAAPWKVQKLPARLDRMSPKAGVTQRDILGPGKS